MFLINPYRFGGGIFSTWGAKSASVNLTNGNRTATATLTTNWTGVRGTQSRSDARYYEATPDVAGANYPMVGLAEVGHSLSLYTGGDANSVGYDAAGNVFYNGLIDTITGYAAGDDVGVLFAPGVGVTFYKNGSAVGGPYAVLTSSTLFPTATFNASGNQITINTGQDPMTVPGGASAWG